MPRQFSIAILALVLSSCASGPSDPAAATPVCESDAECRAMWNAAEMWIEHNTGRPVVEKTESFMSTDMDQSPGNYLSVRVEREPVNGSRWRIESQFYCAKKVGCDPSPWEAQQRFNRWVNRAWTETGD